jgi:hypothetical protein
MKAMTRAKFPLGRVVATPGALEALAESGQTPAFFLDQHTSGNWGVVDEEDWRLNDEALKDGGRILSAYLTLKGRRLWIITEAADDDNGHRTATTLLLPEEY